LKEIVNSTPNRAPIFPAALKKKKKAPDPNIKPSNHHLFARVYIDLLPNTADTDALPVYPSLRPPPVPFDRLFRAVEHTTDRSHGVE
jgi:hypothetical protein